MMDLVLYITVSAGLSTTQQLQTKLSIVSLLSGSTRSGQSLHPTPSNIMDWFHRLDGTEACLQTVYIPHTLFHLSVRIRSAEQTGPALNVPSPNLRRVELLMHFSSSSGSSVPPCLSSCTLSSKKSHRGQQRSSLLALFKRPPPPKPSIPAPKRSERACVLCDHIM